MGPFSIDAGLTIWSVITFLGLLALLARFAFRPLRRLLDQREATIRDALERSERARKEAEELLAQNARRLEEARDEARRIIAEGQRLANEIRRDAEQRARQEAGALVEQARAEIERETQKALAGLTATVANLSVRVAREVVRRQLDESLHEQLAREFIERLRQTHAKGRTV